MVGIDIVNLQRFEKFLNSHKEKALNKFLCESEIKLANSTQSYAGFFAAKEAISKALKTGIGKECSFRDIRLHKDANGAPFFTLSNKIVKKYQIIQTSLSISHDSGFAIAVAIIISSSQYSNPISHLD